MTATSSTLGITFNDTQYSDNGGSLAVKLYQHVALNSLTVKDPANASNSVTAYTASSEIPDLYVEADDNGKATVALSAAYTPAGSAVGAKVLWQIEGNGNGIVAAPNHGSFATTQPTTQLALDGPGPARIQAGVDTNGNNQLDPDEVDAQADVHLVKFNDLTVRDLDHTENSVTDTAATPTPNLYVEEKAGGFATVELIPGFGPIDAGALKHLVWKVTGTAAAADHGTFEVGEGFGDTVSTKLTPTGGNRDFTVTAAFDKNNNGLLDEAAEFTINVYVVVFTEVKATEVNRPEYSATATGTAAVDLIVPLSETGDGVFKFICNTIPADSVTNEKVLWKIDGTEVFAGAGGGGGSTGHFGTNPVRILKPAPNADSMFVLTVGFDDNANHILDLAEVERTINVVLFSVAFDKSYSDQFASSEVNFLPGGTGGRNNNYVLMGGRSDNLGYAKADVKITGNFSKVRSKVMFAFVGIGENSWTRTPAYLTAQDRVRVSSSIPINPSDDGQDYATEMKMVYGLDKNGDSLFTKDEVIGWSPHLFKVVDQFGYEAALAQAAAVVDGTYNIYPYASNFYNGFANNLGLAGAVNTPSQVSGYNPLLDHRVGAAFGADGMGANTLSTFDWSSSISALPYDCANSDEMREKILNLVKAGALASVYSLSGSRTGNPISLPQVTGLFFASGDLHYALGHVELANFSLTYDLSWYGYPVDGRRVTTVSATNVVISGTITDIQDFNYSDGVDGGADAPAHAAAAIQAGYGTLGNGGNVKSIVVNMNNKIPDITLGFVDLDRL